MAAALSRKGEARECCGNERQESSSLDERDEEGDVAGGEKRDEHDVQEEIGARLVMTRVTLPLRLQ